MFFTMKALYSSTKSFLIFSWDIKKMVCLTNDGILDHTQYKAKASFVPSPTPIVSPALGLGL